MSFSSVEAWELSFFVGKENKALLAPMEAEVNEGVIPCSFCVTGFWTKSLGIVGVGGGWEVKEEGIEGKVKPLLYLAIESMEGFRSDALENKDVEGKFASTVGGDPSVLVDGIALCWEIFNWSSCLSWDEGSIILSWTTKWWKKP